MIVIGNKESSPATDNPNKQAESLEELFRKELDAYCAYKVWHDETEDSLLEMALEEIMLDEYLHAKFLRDYLKDRDMYTLKPDDSYEKRFWKIHAQIFED